MNDLNFDKVSEHTGFHGERICTYKRFESLCYLGDDDKASRVFWARYRAQEGKGFNANSKVSRELVLNNIRRLPPAMALKQLEKIDLYYYPKKKGFIGFIFAADQVFHLNARIMLMLEETKEEVYVKDSLVDVNTRSRFCLAAATRHFIELSSSYKQSQQGDRLVIEYAYHDKHTQLRIKDTTIVSFIQE